MKKYYKNMKRFSLVAAACLCGVVGMAQNHNVNNNNNSNTVIINNQPVQRETVVRTETKVVYRDRPNPPKKRVARKLPAPVQLQGYLLVYPEDLGSYSSEPTSIISNINRQGKYGRDNWRVPTSEELDLMKNEADKIGLGELHRYMYDGRYSSGILRLVSTGPSLAEKRKEQELARKREQDRIAAERRRKEAEKEAERKRKAEEDAAIARRKKDAKADQNNLIRSGRVVVYNDAVWQKKNFGANDINDPGRFVNVNELPDGWRLPTLRELRTFAYKSNHTGNRYEHAGLVILEGTYLVTDGDKVKVYNMKMDASFDDNKGLIRPVQDLLN